MFDLFIASCPVIIGYKKEKETHMSIHFTRACVTMCRFYFRMRDKYLLAQAYFFVCICVFMCWQGRTFQRTHVLWQFFADLSWFYITVYIQLEQRSTVEIHCICLKRWCIWTNWTNHIPHHTNTLLCVIWQHLLHGAWYVFAVFPSHSFGIPLLLAPFHIFILYYFGVFVFVVAIYIVSFSCITIGVLVAWIRIKICRLMKQWTTKICNVCQFACGVCGFRLCLPFSWLQFFFCFGRDIPKIIKVIQHWGRTKSRIRRKKRDNDGTERPISLWMKFFSILTTMNKE